MRWAWQIYKALSVLFFTLFLVLLLAGVVALAGIGVVDVPVLSDILARGAAPASTPTVPIVRDATPAASAAAAREAAVQRAEDAISQADEPGRFTIEVTDGDLTALLGEVIAAQDDPPVSNLVVTFEQDAFAASGTVTSPFRANIRAKGHFIIERDTVRLELTEAYLGTLPMPKVLRDQLMQQANSFIGDNVGTARGLRIDSVEIAPGTIRVTGERLEK